MKVISGILKGMNIKGYDIDGTRPTMDRVKESVFATIQNDIKDSICLDLFCGSGNLGIEAISNGAKECYFVDNNIKAINVVKENALNMKILNKCQILNFDYKKSLKFFKEKDIKFDIIFADPPYDYHVIDKIIKLVDELDLLNDNGILIVEFEKEKLLNNYSSLSLIRQKKYSWKNVYIYKKNNLN